MSEKPHNLKEEILDGLELLGLKKLIRTSATLLKNPKLVVDSVTSGQQDFVKPVRYLLAIGAPAIILLNLIDPDVNGWVTSSMTVPLDPAARAGREYFLQQFLPSFNKVVAEYRPLIFLIFLPALAGILRMFFKKYQSSFYYYIAIVYYLGGIWCLMDTLGVLIGSSFHLKMTNVTRPIEVLECLMMIYFVNNIFPGKPIRKIISALLSFIISYAGSFVIMTVVTLSFIFAILGDYEYKPPHMLGDLPVPVRLTDQSLLKRYNVMVKKGMFISEILDHSPAGKAGLQKGDVITQIDNVPLNDYSDERIALDSLASGDSVRVVINRRGVEFIRIIPVVSYDSLIKEPKVTMGITTKFLKDEVNQMGFSSGDKITGIRKGSAADLAHLEINDIIVRRDGDTISTEEFRTFMRERIGQKNPGDTTRLSILRAGQLKEIYLILQAKTPPKP